jgi:tRNA(Ile)-lysidine synthase
VTWSTHVSTDLAGAAFIADLLTRCTFPDPGTRVTCAVSGGPDSTALAVLAVAAGCHAELVHVDHGLRPESGTEFALVADLAGRLGVVARSIAVTVEHGPNLEARARAARFAALPSDVLTGHTADDQAETVVLNLLRGSGLDGLAGMRRDRHPLLGLRRAETHELCRLLGLRTVDDASNDDLVHLRNRVRHDLLPALGDAAHRDLVPVLVRQADLLRDEADLLDRLAADIDPADARALQAAPVALARRAVRRWLTAELGGLPPDAAAVARVLAVAGGEMRACELPGGHRVDRHRQQLRFH